MGEVAKAVFKPFQKILGIEPPKLKSPKPPEDVIDVDAAKEEIDQQEISAETRNQLAEQKKKRAATNRQNRSLLGTGRPTNEYNSLFQGGQTIGNNRLGGF